LTLVYYQPAPQVQVLSPEQAPTQQYTYPVQNFPLENIAPQYQPNYAYQPLHTTLLAPISNTIGNAEGTPQYVEQQGYDPSLSGGSTVQLVQPENQYTIVQPQKQQEQSPQYQQYQQIQQPQQQEQLQYAPAQQQGTDQGISQLVSSTQEFVSGQDLVNINEAAQDYQLTEQDQNKKLFEKNQGETSAVASDGQNTNSKIQEENDNNNADRSEQVQQSNSNGHFAGPIIVEDIYDNKLVSGDNTEIKIIPSREYNAGRALEYPDRQINVQIIKDSQNNEQFLKQTTVSATTEISYRQQEPTANTPSLKIHVTTSLPDTVDSTQRPSTKFLAPINAGLRLSNAGKAFQDCLDLVQHHGPLSQVLLPKPEEKQHHHEKTTVEVQKSVNVKNIFIQENAPIYQTRYFLKQPKNIQIAPQQNFVQNQNFVQQHEEVQNQNLVQHHEAVQNLNFVQQYETVQHQNFVQQQEAVQNQNFVQHHEEVQKIVEIEAQPQHAEKLVQEQIQPNVSIEKIIETPVVEQKVFEYPVVNKNPVRPVQLVKVLQYQLPVQAPVIAIPHQNINGFPISNGYLSHNTLHEHSHQASNQALGQNSLFNGHLAPTQEQIYYKPLQPVQRHQEFGLDNGYLPPFAEFTQYESKPKAVYGLPVMSHFHAHQHNSYAGKHISLLCHILIFISFFIYYKCKYSCVEAYM
jgi:hypothetical protein